MRLTRRCAVLLAAFLVGGCGGGGSNSSPPGAVGPGPSDCTGACAGPGTFLTVADVERVLAQAIAEAVAVGAPATIAVVDRVGNVLAVFRMTGAATTVTVRSTGTAPPVDGGLEGVALVPDTMAAIAKAVTGAYLSSEGNAFSTRTAGQIIQDHFNPGEILAPGGPLFGVQFSQLPCSDLSLRYGGGSPDAGPKRAPLGLAADPGGFPLYKGGTPVGGVGVVADGVYGLDRDVSDRDQDADEFIALAGTYGAAAPDSRHAERITADGKTLRFSDATFSELRTDPAAAPPFATVDGVAGNLVPVAGYFAGTVLAGTAFGQPVSGIRPDAADFPGLDAYVLVDDADTPRYPPTAGTEPVGALTVPEVREILAAALNAAARARAQIRQPLGSAARVTISVVDSSGVILGIARSPDAPVFGVDVSLQKARTAAFLSSSSAAGALNGLPPAGYIDVAGNVIRTVPIGPYVTALRDFLGQPAALADGVTAWSARATGNVARPFYPDGVDGAPPGPFARPAGEWSPFSTGLQLDLAYNALIQHVAFVAGLAPDVPANCTGVGPIDTGFAVSGAIPGLANGLQIFPGGVPVYRGGELVGAIGVSGDGVDQDDMIAFLGVHAAGLALAGAIGNAPAARRTDQLVPAGGRLRYVNCPQAPFLGSTEEGACDGK